MIPAVFAPQFTYSSRHRPAAAVAPPVDKRKFTDLRRETAERAKRWQAREDEIKRLEQERREAILKDRKSRMQAALKATLTLNANNNLKMASRKLPPSQPSARPLSKEEPMIPSYRAGPSPMIADSPVFARMMDERPKSPPAQSISLVDSLDLASSLSKGRVSQELKSAIRKSLTESTQLFLHLEREAFHDRTAEFDERDENHEEENVRMATALNTLRNSSKHVHFGPSSQVPQPTLAPSSKQQLHVQTKSADKQAQSAGSKGTTAAPKSSSSSSSSNSASSNSASAAAGKKSGLPASRVPPSQPKSKPQSSVPQRQPAADPPIVVQPPPQSSRPKWEDEEARLLASIERLDSRLKLVAASLDEDLDAHGDEDEEEETQLPSEDDDSYFDEREARNKGIRGVAARRNRLDEVDEMDSATIVPPALKASMSPRIAKTASTAHLQPQPQPQPQPKKLPVQPQKPLNPTKRPQAVPAVACPPPAVVAYGDDSTVTVGDVPKAAGVNATDQAKDRLRLLKQRQQQQRLVAALPAATRIRKLPIARQPPQVPAHPSVRIMYPLNHPQQPAMMRDSLDDDDGFASRGQNSEREDRDIEEEILVEGGPQSESEVVRLRKSLMHLLLSDTHRPAYCAEL